MALFGRKRREEPAPVVDEEVEETPVEIADLSDGPYDVEDAPADDMPRLDLGSVRFPVPDGAQLQVEMDPAGPVRAVHVLTQIGQLTITAYAAPRSGGLWREVCGELADQLRGDGAKVHSTVGDWGQELAATMGEASLRFVGVDGPRWMLRGVVAGPPQLADQSAKALRELLRRTVVVRGPGPMPVRTPLPLELPPAIAEHIAAAQQGEA